MTHCLALNASYEPLRLMPVKRALRLVLQGKAEIIESGDKSFRSAGREVPVPAVIRLTRFIHVPRKFRKHVTNTFLFARDEYRCQYCGRFEGELGRRESLTREHVIPTSRGGQNEWTNVVTACSTCNHRKSDRTPAEAGMTLLKPPVEPQLVQLVWPVRRLTVKQRKYIEMFYGAEAVKAFRS